MHWYNVTLLSRKKTVTITVGFRKPLTHTHRHKCNSTKMRSAYLFSANISGAYYIKTPFLAVKWFWPLKFSSKQEQQICPRFQFSVYIFFPCCRNMEKLCRETIFVFDLQVESRCPIEVSYFSKLHFLQIMCECLNTFCSVSFEFCIL